MSEKKNIPVIEPSETPKEEIVKKKPKSVFTQFITKEIPSDLVASFREFCARKTATNKINFSDVSELEKLKKQFLG